MKWAARRGSFGIDLLPVGALHKTKDALLLAMPISWRGMVVQYLGRLERRHAGKSEVLEYDYVDRAVPLLARMFEKRLRTYRALGYADTAQAGKELCLEMQEAT